MYWILIPLMLIPHVVSAECAWVLWARLSSETIDARGNPEEREGVWKVERALPTMSRCHNLLAELIQIYTRKEVQPPAKREVVTGETNGIIITSGQTAQGGSWSFTRDFLCLPDTVDPRAPKQ
jgi:hypothetical protein